MRLYVARTGHSLSGAFLTYWKNHYGAMVLGAPICRLSTAKARGLVPGATPLATGNSLAAPVGSASPRRWEDARVTAHRPVRPADSGWLDWAPLRERRPLHLHVGRKPLRHPPLAGNRERVCTATPVPGNRLHPKEASCLRRAAAHMPPVPRMGIAHQIGLGAKARSRCARWTLPPRAKAPGVPRLKARHSDAPRRSRQPCRPGWTASRRQ
jgi:hypothetical protein